MAEIERTETESTPSITPANESVESFIQNYTDEEGQNPFTASLNLLTFAGSIPLHILKAIGLGLLVYLGGNLGLHFLEASNYLLLAGLVLGILPVLFIAASGSMSFIAKDFIANVTGLFQGILSPADQIYDRWKERSTGEISKKEFTMAVFKQIVVPHATGAVTSHFLMRPFRKGLAKRMDQFLGRVSKNVTPKEEKKIEKEGGDSFITRMSQAIIKGGNRTGRAISWPLRISIISSVLFWALLILIHFL